jgi:GTP-binding protein
VPTLKIRSLAVACTTLDPARFPRSPWAEVAVAGRSNVGKSSLLNTLFERKNFARISKDPGKTRTVNFYVVNDRFYLVDLPGYGFARLSASARSAWARVINAYLEGRDSLAGVVQLIDARHAPSAEDAAMIARLVDARRQFVVVFTKADKISRGERSRAMKLFNEALAGVARVGDAGAAGGDSAGGGSSTIEAPAIFFSAKTGEGREELWRWIAERV